VDAVRIGAVLVVLAVGAFPRLAITIGGIAGADYRVRTGEHLTRQQFADRLRDSTALLVGSLIGVAVVGTGLGTSLASAPGNWDRLLCLTMATGLLLRSRTFSQLGQALPLRVAGSLGVVGGGIWLAARTPALRPWTVVLVAAAFVVLALVSVVPVPAITRVRIRHLFNLAELVLLVALVLNAALALDLFHLAAALTR
jgi:hypothetical protein